MSSVNKVILVGNVGADPEIRRMQNGDPIANLRIATEESWKDKNTGERQSRVEWHRIVSFNKGLTSVIEKYVRKGSKLYIEGQLQTRKWVDQQGTERYSTEVVLKPYNGNVVLLNKVAGTAGANPRDEDAGFDQGDPDPAPKGNAFGTGSGEARKPGNNMDIDDEIPF